MSLTWVYLIKDRTTGYHKIGRSDTPASRLKTLCHQDTKQPVPNEFVLVEAWWCDGKTEQTLHSRFTTKRLRGEWFDLSEADIEKLFKYMFQRQRYTQPYRFDNRDEIDDLFRKLERTESDLAYANHRLEQASKLAKQHTTRNHALLQALTEMNDYVSRLQSESRRAWEFADKNGFSPKISERLKELPSLTAVMQKFHPIN